MDKKKLLAIVLFLLMGFFMFTFANPSEEQKEIDDKNTTEDKTKDIPKDNIEQVKLVNNNQTTQIINTKNVEDAKEVILPTITVEPKTVKIVEGTNYDVMENVSAKSKDGEILEVTPSIKDTSKLLPGRYEIIYEITDKDGNKNTETRELIVVSKTGDEDSDGYTNEEEQNAKTDFDDENSKPDYSNKPVLNLENIKSSIVVYDTISREEILSKISATREFYTDSLVLDVDMTNVDFYNVGTYKIYVSATDILGNRTEEEIPFTVLRRKVTVKIMNQESIYKEDLKELTSNEQENIYKNNAIKVSLKTNADKNVVGKYEINGTYENKNYDVTFIDGTYSVTSKTLTKEDINKTFEDQEYTYDNKEHNIYYENTNDYDITYENNGRTDVGSQTVLVTLTGKGNYEGTLTYEVELKVVPKEIEVTWTDLEFTYDKEKHVPKATYEDLDIKVEEAKINAGTYKAKATTSSNYKIINDTTEFIIKKSTITKEDVNKTFEDQEYTYDNKEHNIYYENTNDYDITYKNNGRTDVGSQTVLVTLTGKGNYEGTLTYEVELKVVPKEIEVTWTDLEFTYDKEKHVPKATYEDLDIKVEGSKINAGTYEAKATTSSNYKIINATTEFIIKKANPTFTKPEGLEAFEDEKLYDVKLPDGFYFEEENKELQEGTLTTTVKYIPEDSNYEEVTNIEVSILVKPRFFEVKFFDYYNNQIGNTQTIRYHESAIAPNDYANEITLSNGTVLVNPTWDKDYSDITENTNVYIKYTKVLSAKTAVYILKDGKNLPNPIYAPNDNKNYDLLVSNITIKDDVSGSLAKVVEKASESDTNEAYIAINDDVYNYLTEDSKKELDNLLKNKNYTIKYYVLKYVTSSGWHLDGYRIYNEDTISIENRYNFGWKTYIKTNSEIKNVTVKHSVFNYRNFRWETKTSNIRNLRQKNDEYYFDYIDYTSEIKVTLKSNKTITFKYVDGIYIKED